MYFPGFRNRNLSRLVSFISDVSDANLGTLCNSFKFVTPETSDVPLWGIWRQVMMDLVAVGAGTRCNSRFRTPWMNTYDCSRCYGEYSYGDYTLLLAANMENLCEESLLIWWISANMENLCKYGEWRMQSCNKLRYCEFQISWKTQTFYWFLSKTAILNEYFTLCTLLNWTFLSSDNVFLLTRIRLNVLMCRKKSVWTLGCPEKIQCMTHQNFILCRPNPVYFSVWEN